MKFCDNLIFAAFALLNPLLVAGKKGGNNNASPSNYPKVCSNAEEIDVVVIGAGVCGHVTAKLLKDYREKPHLHPSPNPYPNGFKFAVLEKGLRRLVGRSVAARYLMGGDPDTAVTGDGNPLAEFLQAYPSIGLTWKEFDIVNVFDETVASYFANGAVSSNFSVHSSFDCGRE